MADLYNAPAVLLIGNDARSRIRWSPGRFAPASAITARAFTRSIRLPSKLHRQAKIAVAGRHRAAKHDAVRWLASAKGNFDAKTTEGLVAAEGRARSREATWSFSSARIFTAPRSAIWFRSAARFGGKTKFMALGDYANSRGAADMGLLPDRLPGYAHLSRCSRARAIRQALGRRSFRQARTDGSRDDGSRGRRKAESSLRRRRESR